METQIYNSSELDSRFPFRVDTVHDSEILTRLVEDPDVYLQSPFHPVGHYEYHGHVMVGAEPVELKFHHKGSGKGSRLSALRCSNGVSVDAVRLLRQVVYRNANVAGNDLGITVNRPAFRAQPERMQVRVNTDGRGGRTGISTSSTSHQDSFGYWGERHVMNHLLEHFPETEIEWRNVNEEEGLPYDILLNGRLAFDVKATRIERSHVVLSEAEGEFRRTVGQHHAVAVVTLGDDKKALPLAIDLYTGVPLVRSDPNAVRKLLTDLPALQREVAGDPAQIVEVNGSPAYFVPGRYVSSAVILDLKSDGHVAAMGDDEVVAQYEISGHFVVLRNHDRQDLLLPERLHIVTDGESRQLITPDGDIYLLQGRQV